MFVTTLLLIVRCSPENERTADRREVWLCQCITCIFTTSDFLIRCHWDPRDQDRAFINLKSAKRLQKLDIAHKPKFRQSSLFWRSRLFYQCSIQQSLREAPRWTVEEIVFAGKGFENRPQNIKLKTILDCHYIGRVPMNWMRGVLLAGASGILLVQHDRSHLSLPVWYITKLLSQ